MTGYMQKAGLAVMLGVGICAQTGAQAPQTPRENRTAGAAAATTSTAWTRKTAWGEPDLQGIWTNATTTPFERPESFGNRAFLTEQEYEVKRAQDAKRAAEGETAEDRARPGVGAGPTFWYERGTPLRQTSLIIDPPDGQLPALTPQAQERFDARRKALAGVPASPLLWESQGQWIRCISRGVPGGLIPVAYNNNYQIIQTPGQVVIHMEMIHETRIIPTDGRPRLPNGVRQWLGSSWGYWEGDTLVVETTNFHPEAQMNRGPHLLGIDARVIERFTRKSATEIDYELFVDAPSTFVRPWTASIPLFKDGAPDRMMEYACVEGDHAVRLTVLGLLAEKQKSKK
jgi:hypothetical protein